MTSGLPVNRAPGLGDSEQIEEQRSLVDALGTKRFAVAGYD